MAQQYLKQGGSRPMVMMGNKEEFANSDPQSSDKAPLLHKGSKDVKHHHQRDHRFRYPPMPQRGGGSAQEWIHWVLTLLHILVVIVAISISIWTTTFAFDHMCDSDNQCRPGVYITNTFHSTKRIGGSSPGWAVATERTQMGDGVVQYPAEEDSFAFSHYYECMHTAQMADGVCFSEDLSVQEYVTCLNNNTNTKAALTACDSLSASFSQPWPTAEEYLQCLFRFPVMRHSSSVRGSQNVFRTCLSKTMWPFYEVQQGVDSSLFLGSYNWLIFLVVGLVCMTSFGVYTASPWEHGKVNYGDPDWHMRLGALWATISFLWNLSFFIAFLIVGVRAGTDAAGDSNVPTTQTTTVLTLLFLGFYVAYFLVELVEMYTHVGVFVLHVYKHATKRRHYKDRDSAEETYESGVVKFERGQRVPDGGTQAAQLGSCLPLAHVKYYDISAADVAKYYTPPLLSTWADGYMADPLIFLGLMGASGPVTTHDAWNIFQLVFFYRFLNSQICRYMYMCFMNNLSLQADENKMYHGIKTVPGSFFRGGEPSDGHRVSALTDWREDNQPDGEDGEDDDPEKKAVSTAHPHGSSDIKKEPHLNIQAMALSSQIANILLLSGILYLAFHGNSAVSSSGPFSFMVWCGFLVPEILRILTHVICQIWAPEPNSVPWKLLNVHMFIWVFDLAVRVCVVAFVVLNLSSPQGTRRFLFEKNWELLDVYLPMLAQGLS